MRTLMLVPVLCGGCFASSVGVSKAEPILPEEVAMLKTFSPEQITAYMKARPATVFSFVGADGMEVVERSVELSTDGKGGRKLVVHSGHRGDAEFVKAAVSAAVESALKGAAKAVVPVP